MSNSKKKRSYQEIRSWLFGLLRKTSGKKVAYNHRVSTHIGNGAATLYAYLVTINAVQGFAEDGLTLVPGDVLVGFNVEQLLGAIFDDYKTRNWEIYYA